MDDFDWFGGDDSYIDSGDTGDSGSWNVSDTDANSPWASGDTGGGSLFGGGSNTGGGASTGGSTDWTRWLAQAGLGAVTGYADNAAKEKMSKEDWKAKTQYMKDQLAETEKYYQAHGKQLTDAYAGYSKYYSPATNHGVNNPTSIFGLLTPQTPAVTQTNGFPYDTPIVNTPPQQQLGTPLPGHMQGHQGGLLGPYNG